MNLGPKMRIREAATPLYTYRCEQGHRYEKREPFGAPAEQRCQRCDRLARRVFVPPAISFKGSGWYKTDSRGSETSSAAQRKSKSESDSADSTKARTAAKAKPGDGSSNGGGDSAKARPPAKGAGKTSAKAAE
ncbi:MAG: hypothetical protein EXR65_03950 [Dehalococcoidia bacterium]|nr:hypothetical protein [Dehalococcoidia bacterium]